MPANPRRCSFRSPDLSYQIVSPTGRQTMQLSPEYEVMLQILSQFMGTFPVQR